MNVLRSAAISHLFANNTGGLTAGAYGRPAVFALLVIVLGLVALKLI